MKETVIDIKTRSLKFVLPLLGMVALVGLFVWNQQEEPAESRMMTLTYTKSLVLADANSSSAVAEACKRVKWIKGRPNPRAAYYIIVKGGVTGYVYKRYTGKKVRNSYTYMESMGRELAAHHKMMKKDERVDIILITNDEEKETTRKFMKECKARYAVTDLSEEIFMIPGVDKLSYEGQAVVVRVSDGAVIKSGSYKNIVPRWEDILLEAGDSAGGAGN